MEPRGIERSIVAVGLPSRRHEHAARDSGAVHFAQQLVVTERNLPGRPGRIFFGVGFLRRLRRPNVNLRIDDRHMVLPPGVLLPTAKSNIPSRHEVVTKLRTMIREAHGAKPSWPSRASW